VRLAVFTSKYPARISTFFERDLRALMEAGAEVDVFTIHPLDASLWRYALLSEDQLARTRVHHIGFGQCFRRAKPWPLGKVGTFLRDVAAISASAVRWGVAPLAKSAYVFPKAWAWADLHRAQYDHVLAYWGNYPGTCAYLYHRLNGRSIPFSIWLHAGTDLYRDRVYLREKLLYADSIITCCEFNRGFISEAYPDIAPALLRKTHVCYHGLDLPEFPYQPEDRHPNRVIAVGRLSKRKGFDYLLRAAYQLEGRGVKVHIDLVGDGEEQDALKALAAELGISSRVRFHGWLQFAEVRAAMREATVLVHPSDGLGDGLPNVLREAMALGTPVVASQVAGIPEALDDGRCGLLVPPKDTGALADAIQLLLTNPALRREYAGRARKRTEEKFDVWQNGARLAEHLRCTPHRASGTDAKPTLSLAETPQP
jgi:colanic acid/amylovoran biosynthesis glycosyltransferase